MKLIFNSKLYILYVLFSIFINNLVCEAKYNNEEVAADPEAKTSLIIELEDSTFEKKTQASTGGTSGVWFVKFYAPWCGHCRSMENAWNELADMLDQKVNVAKIDATKHTSTSKRFGITSFPTLILLKDGNYYQYEGGNRTANALKQFALHGYKQVNSKPVPKEWSAFDRFKMFIRSGLYEAKRIHQLAFPGFVTICFISVIFGALLGGAGVFAYIFYLENKFKFGKKTVKAD